MKKGFIELQILEESNPSIELIKELLDELPDYMDREYPKGTVDRGHAMVHIIKFLLDAKQDRKPVDDGRESTCNGGPYCFCDKGVW